MLDPIIFATFAAVTLATLPVWFVCATARTPLPCRVTWPARDGGRSC